MFKLLRALLGKREPDDSRALDTLYEAQYFARYTVKANIIGITCINPDGKVDSIKWDAISQVTMMSNMFFISEAMLNKDGGFNENYKTVSVPVGATGQDELVGGMLNKLDGFDKAAFLNALGNTTKERFVIWKREETKI